MFARAKFNQPLNGWRVDNANMHGMFAGASAFNQPLNDWRVDKVTYAYDGHSSFNQPLNNWTISCRCNTTMVAHRLPEQPQ